MQIRWTLKYFEVKKGTRRDGRFQTDTIFGITREDSLDGARHRLV